MIHTDSEDESVQRLVKLGMQNSQLGCEDYSPFPSRMFALLYVLLHVPQSPVSYL